MRYSIDEADGKRLVHHAAYNVSAMSVEPETVKASIQKILPEFELGYGDPDRQAIADTWPNQSYKLC